MCAMTGRYWSIYSTGNSTRHRMTVWVDFNPHWEHCEKVSSLYSGQWQDGFPYVPVPQAVVVRVTKLIVTKRGPKIDDMPCCLGITIVSRRLRDLLVQFDSTVRFSPANVSVPKGMMHDLPEYFWVHVSRVVPCEDVQRSKWTMDAPKPSLSRFVLDEDRVPPNVHCFRPWGYENKWIVSNEVRIAIEGAGMRGCLFAEPTNIVTW
mgnify:CR=1 FL=1